MFLIKEKAPYLAQKETRAIKSAQRPNEKAHYRAQKQGQGPSNQHRFPSNLYDLPPKLPKSTERERTAEIFSFFIFHFFF